MLIRFWARIRFVAWIILPLAVTTGCAYSPEQQAQLDDAIDFTSGALAVATAANQIANSGSGQTPVAPPTLTQSRPGGTASQQGAANPTGYNQREAFEDCEKFYRASGMPQQAAECAARAQGMQSLTPPRR